MAELTPPTCLACGAPTKYEVDGRRFRCTAHPSAHVFSPDELETPVTARRRMLDAKTPNAEVIKEREKVYGPPEKGFKRVGEAWAALLNEHFLCELPALPPHLVGLMLASLKLQRAAKPYEGHLDNYVDATNYVALAQQLDRRLDAPGA